MTATFVLHGFLRGSKGSVPDCPLRSIPIHSAGGARYAFGLPSICLQPVFNLASHSGFTATLLANSCGRIGANRGERLRRSRLAMEEESIRSSRVLTCESSLASPHLRVLTYESSLASPHLRVLTCESSLASPHLRVLAYESSLASPHSRVLTPCDTPTWRVVEVRRYLCGSPRKDKGNSQTSHRMCR